MKNSLFWLLPSFLLLVSCNETIETNTQLAPRTVCSGTFSERYSVTLSSGTIDYSDIGAWHNTFMDYIDTHNGIGFIPSPSVVVDTIRASANRGVVYYTAFPFSSISSDVSTDIKNNFLPLIGSTFPLGSTYLSNVKAAVNLRIDSLYNSGFINSDAKDLLYDIFIDIADGSNTVDFEELYNTLDGFYESDDLSSAICAATLAISEHSLCYWEDHPDSNIGNGCIILIADAAGAVFHAWWGAAVKIYHHDYEYEIEDCLEDMAGGAIVSSGLSLFGL